MKWEGRRKSDNMEDRRGMGGTGKVLAGGGLIGIIFLVVQMFMGGDNQQLIQQLQYQMLQTESGEARELTSEEIRLGEMCSVILAETEDVWNAQFAKYNMKYKEPKMVLFSGGVRSACGNHGSSSGPFYCPADETVYMDLDFFKELESRFGAKGGDFAIAYVIAHEVGHHVQKQLGVLEKVHNIRQKVDQVTGNHVYVSMELQADFYAGLWAHHIQKLLEPGDIEEALSAAAAVGDDAIQKRTQGYVVPESFTHGTSEERVYWFKRGFTTGDMKQGDTFAERK